MTDDLADTLADIVARLAAAGIEYMIVGSIAALAHGRTRATQDLDLVIAASEPSLRALVDALPPERYYVSIDAALDALRRESMFNVIDLRTGWKLDFITRKKRAYSQIEFHRRQRMTWFGTSLSVASPEDVIVAKLEWAKLGGGSARQLDDVRELMRALGDFDRAYVERWVEELGLAAEWQAAGGPSRDSQ